MIMILNKEISHMIHPFQDKAFFHKIFLSQDDHYTPMNFAICRLNFDLIDFESFLSGRLLFAYIALLQFVRYHNYNQLSQRKIR